ncbi:hypothetical protein GCM10016455_26210 [Aliiroseovarius zhejiangensis]|uniref:Uncharacterized protein n=1 Tax=Aliiroseovarius zhejiangensis TaxID=1632025 RepID=A0ABQ3J651_9RHOB|nr:hypothetical protein [Aliiroseovarius zhejiangensis]GHF03635.1 hypothetical protein GCM10016455_26210 [Aliiroseovarius zhejiangensis]
MTRRLAYALAFLALPAAAPAQEVTTYGDCSPIVQNVGGDVTVICYKDQSRKPKFRVVYYRLGGVGQSFLLNGILSPEWEKYLGGQQAIVNNAVHKEIRFLTDKFGQRIWGSNLFGSVAFEGGDFGVGLADYATRVDAGIDVMDSDAGRLPNLQEADGWRVYGEGELFVPDLDAAESLFLRGAVPAAYQAFWGTSSGPARWVVPGATLTAPTLWRSLTPDDLKGYEDRYQAYLGRALDISRDAANQSELRQRAERGLFANAGAGYFSDRPIEHRPLDALRYLSRNGLPEGYAIVKGEPGVHYGWAFTVSTRSADLLVAVLENVGDQPMEVGAFSIAETEEMTLRRHDDTQALLLTADPVDKRLWPPGVLAPGEKLVIPVRIEMPLMPEFLDWVVEGYREAFAPGEAIRAEAQALGDRPILFVHPSATDNALFSLRAQDMPKGRIPVLEPRFEYGPAWAIQAVEVDGTRYDFRQHDPNNFILFAGGGIGSCPYIYTYHSDGDVWVEENHVLLGATSPDLKRTDRLKLSHFEGRLEIREKEHELAHLDQISLILRNADGQETVYPATWPKPLTHEDGQNLVLGYNEASEVRFDLPDGALKGKTVFLSATGYYVPLSDPALFANRAP